MPSASKGNEPDHAHHYNIQTQMACVAEWQFDDTKFSYKTDHL